MISWLECNDEFYASMFDIAYTFANYQALLHETMRMLCMGGEL